MEKQALLVDPLNLVGGCGCPDCCSRTFDPSIDAQFNADSYEQFSLVNFAAAVVQAAEAAEPQLARTTESPQTQANTVNGVSALDGPREVPVVAAAQGASAIAFSDVSQSSGLDIVTQTWGSVWGDFDGDGLIDKWLNRHQLSPILYRNRGDGTFEDVTDSVFLPEEIRGDFHGAAFVDINNDGTQDLIQLAGGDQGESDDNPNKQKKLFINQGGQFRNQSVELGVDYLIGRGRVPVPFDLNNDGLLDYVFTGPPRIDGTAPPTIFQQNTDGTFANIGAQVNLDDNVASGTFGLVSDLTGDGRLELIYGSQSPKLTIYDTTQLPLRDITDELQLSSGTENIQDVAVGDFNGDGRQDLFLVRGASSASGVRFDGGDVNDSQSGRVRLLVNRPLQRGVEVVTGGSVSLNFQGDPEIDVPQFMRAVGIVPSDIRIGAAGSRPDSLIFSLDALNAQGEEIGIPTYTPGVDRGVFIGYENGRWQIMLSHDQSDEVSFLYEFSEPIEDFLAVNFNPFPVRNNSILLINTEDGFVDQTALSGVGDIDVSATNVVTGDLDNDGDLDIYIVASDLTQNQPNVLLDNQGDGTFKRVVQAGGAEGTTLGLGDSAALADYDNDGDLDLFVTNGDVTGFLRPFYLDGGVQLFRNDLDNGNHYLIIDLEGVASNRDAIGARVEVTAGGTTQVREQNGGIHNRAQNDQRLHFGLGQNDLVERIEILWPSGLREVINNVAVDQIITILEGSSQGGGSGGNGNQVIEGTSAGDVLVGSGGRDVIRGRAGRDFITGLGGNDNLFGNSGADTLNGGAGNDLIVGNEGNDVLTGGAGADSFLFNSARDGSDIITDFDVSVDIIRLNASRFGGGLTVGNLAGNQFHLGAAATQASHRVIYNQRTGQLFFDQDGTGGSAALLLATLQGTPNLSVNDIKLV
jgi:Ca2+-binding RTX toxin-like protein